jgi:hypothetical protein
MRWVRQGFEDARPLSELAESGTPARARRMLTRLCAREEM